MGIQSLPSFAVDVVMIDKPADFLAGRRVPDLHAAGVVVVVGSALKCRRLGAGMLRQARRRFD